MKTTGILCEYNPFHGGHALAIREAKARGAAAVVCVMSGNFTQRGLPAIADKYARAEMALRGGADVVVELPFPFSCAGAEFFAEGGLSILADLGVEDLLFGSECGDLDFLGRAADAAEPAKRAEHEAGQGSATAHFSALSESLGEARRLNPNDILAVEYLAAIKKHGYAIEPHCLRRQGAGYRDETLDTSYPSATAIRKAILADDGRERALEALPDAAREILARAMASGEAPAELSRARTALLAWFRLHTPEELEAFAEMGGGLGGRIHHAAEKAGTLPEFFSLCSTKKYTDSRIRRAMLFAMCGVRESDLREKPRFTTLLASNKTGRKFLADVRRTSNIPVLGKSADFRTLGEIAVRQAELSFAADALYTLMLPGTVLPGDYRKKKPYSE